MTALINGLLEFSRLSRQPLAKTHIDIRGLGEDCLATLKPELAGRDLEVVVGDLANCVGDPVLLRQVWTNLLSNAIKFTREQPHGRIEVSCEQQPCEVIYSVRDNGVGFDMRCADRLFGVFQRLHRADEFEGTGVGLAIVQRIVQRHGGRAWASAEPGKGAVFFFSLPCDLANQA
jgi:light-regulated signal transduction histidine kinase (bacteriophytochrome)